MIIDNKLLTIIIPTYNNPNALRVNILKLVKFLSVSTDISINIIIADDGSKSENRKLNEQFLCTLNLPYIEYHYHENLGLEANELFLIEKVKTKYAMLLGEDDYLSDKYLNKVFNYLKKYEVGVILSNFFVIDEEGRKTKRACRNRLHKDKLYRIFNYKLMFLAHQMSGIVFQIEGLLDYYKANVPHNVYPQLSFIANSIEKGVNIHITDCPFACTVLKKRRFNYSVDGLIYDLLLNVIAISKTKKQRRNLINYFLFRWSGQFCNLSSWKSPIKFWKKVNGYSLLTSRERVKIRITFLISYFIAPFRIFYRFGILPLIGKAELKKINYTLEVDFEESIDNRG